MVGSNMTFKVCWGWEVGVHSRGPQRQTKQPDSFLHQSWQGKRVFLLAEVWDFETSPFLPEMNLDQLGWSNVCILKNLPYNKDMNYTLLLMNWVNKSQGYLFGGLAVSDWSYSDLGTTINCKIVHFYLFTSLSFSLSMLFKAAMLILSKLVHFDQCLKNQPSQKKILWSLWRILSVTIMRDITVMYHNYLCLFLLFFYFLKVHREQDVLDTPVTATVRRH